MPKNIKANGKQIVLAVRRFCEMEKANKGPLIPFDNIRLRVAAMTGISEKTVYNITKEIENAAAAAAAAPPKKTRKPRKKRSEQIKEKLSDKTQNQRNQCNVVNEPNNTKGTQETVQCIEDKQDKQSHHEQRVSRTNADVDNDINKYIILGSMDLNPT